MAFEANCGPVDRLRGATLPEQVSLRALVLLRSPGPDGVHYKETDIISSEATEVAFAVDNYRLMSVEEVSIPLKTGSWPSAFLLLVDDEGEPFASGGVRTPDGQPVGGSLDASKNRILIQYNRRFG